MKLKKVLSFILVALVIIPSAILFTGCSAAGTYRRTEINVSFDREEQTITYSEYKKTYGKDDFDYKNASAVEQTTARECARKFGYKLQLNRDGNVYAIYDFPDGYLEYYCLEEQPEKSKEGTWSEGDTKDEIILGNIVCERKGNKFYHLGSEFKKC